MDLPYAKRTTFRAIPLHADRMGSTTNVVLEVYDVPSRTQNWVDVAGVPAITASPSSTITAPTVLARGGDEDGFLQGYPGPFQGGLRLLNLGLSHGNILRAGSLSQLHQSSWGKQLGR